MTSASRPCGFGKPRIELTIGGLIKLADFRSHSGGSLVLFGLQVAAHLSLIPLVIFGSWPHYLCVAFVYFLTGCFGMSMTYHRDLSHRSWKSPSWFQKLGVLCATIGLTGGPISWAAIHREHHARTDLPQDPHSPRHQSFWRVQYLSMFAKPKLKITKDLVRNPFLKWVQRHYLGINLAYAAILFFISPFAVVYAYLAPAAVLWNAGSFINNFGHTHGYRNFETADTSRNNFVLGIFMWGEGWHNNHHSHPRKARFSEKWYELDISYFFIRPFRRRQA